MNGQTTRFTWDDEDRLASTTLPEGHTDGNACTGLGMRLSKTDGGVSYAYLCDGVSPASPVLSDGQLSFTPGISQTLGTPNGSGGMSYASHFYAEDAVGNLRGMSDAGAQGFPDAYNWDAFGQLIGRAGGTSTPFGYGEGSGYQADGDSGLRLLGHRYYDSRTGRFISQDPAKSGENWYQYAGNDPINSTDPTGLSLEGGGPSPFESMAAGGVGALAGNQSFLDSYDSFMQKQKEQSVDADHPAWDHYLGKTGTSMSVNVNDLPNPSYDLLDDPSVKKITGGDVSPGHTYRIDIAKTDLNFKDLLIGRAVGHFVGTLTIGMGGQYSLNGKMFIYPDTYKFNNDPKRGFLLNAATNATRSYGNLRGGGKNFTINVNGYMPIHSHNGG